MAMNESIARQYNQQYNYPLHDIDHLNDTATQVEQPSDFQVKRTIGKSAFTRLEKAVMSLIGVSFIALSIASISMSSALTSVSQDVQDLNRQVNDTTVVNNNLEQNVQELSRYDRVYQIGKEHDLGTNNSNIRNVQ